MHTHQDPNIDLIYFIKRMNPSLNSQMTTTTMTMTKSRRQEVKVSCMTNTALNCGQEAKCEFHFENILMFVQKITFFQDNFFFAKINLASAQSLSVPGAVVLD